MSRFTDDEICRLCGEGIEHHHMCPHNGATCGGSCPEPDCHRVTGRKIPGPLTKLLPVCVLCGPVASATDPDGVKEARAKHHAEVVR